MIHLSPRWGFVGGEDSVFYTPIAPLGLYRQMQLKHDTNNNLS